MGLTLNEAAPRKSTVRYGTLPPRMRVLYITTYHRTGGWLAEAFASDSAVDVLLEESIGAAAGMSRLRDERFDAVLISHEPGELDALELVEALRTGGTEEPLIMLGQQCEQELAPLCYEVGGDAYVGISASTTRSLIWIVARAVERHQVQRENMRLAQADQHRLRLEHDEANRLLQEQQALLTKLDHPDDSRPPLQLPQRLIDHYRELLRTYVIMGSGNLADEMAALAEMLASVDVTAPEAMQMHLGALSELVRGLGTRSARHVMTRADLLALELTIHLGECYRRRWSERRDPPQQMRLPGFA